MKIIKWMLYVLLVLVALVLILPLFMPAVVEISAESKVSVSPAQVFHNAALYKDRNKWDPWLETEPDAHFHISPSPDYVGSEYTWNGKKIKSGKMIVDSVVFGKYIASEIYFGDDPEPGLVEWFIEASGDNTMITWKFTTETKYPVGRLMMSMFKGSMEQSFKKGLANFSRYLEKNPPRLSKLGTIEEGVLPPMLAMVAPARGTMDQYAEQMAELFPRLMQEAANQGLQIAGAPFTHYISYDEETEMTDYLCGIPVGSKGKEAGGMEFRYYKETPAIQAMHTGPYEEFNTSYMLIMEYLDVNMIETTDEAMEFYYTDPQAEPNVTKWQTLIAFPLK